jgi:cell division septation protein DedD
VTKPAPKPTPAVKQKPAGKALYSVQIGVFRSDDNANSLVKKYKEKGYDAFIQKSTTQDKGVLNRVLIGRFNKRKEAAVLAKNISSKENINVIIFRQ